VKALGWRQPERNGESRAGPHVDPIEARQARRQAREVRRAGVKHDAMVRKGLVDEADIRLIELQVHGLMTQHVEYGDLACERSRLPRLKR